MNKKAVDVLKEAGYDQSLIEAGIQYANKVGWEDEDDFGALILAHILYSKEDLKTSPRAPWEPIC